MKLTEIREIYSTEGAFAAIKTNGSVITWGDPNYGGNSAVVVEQLSDIRKIYSTAWAFAAIKFNQIFLLTKAMKKYEKQSEEEISFLQKFREQSYTSERLLEEKKNQSKKLFGELQRECEQSKQRNC